MRRKTCWLDLLELNVKLVDTPRAVASHLLCPPLFLFLLFVEIDFLSACSSRGVFGSLTADIRMRIPGLPNSANPQ
jgi:hypothetical protein